MSTPKIGRTPNLSRLLGPGEEVIYTGRLHPFYGCGWLLAAAAVAGLGWLWTWYLLVPALVLLGIYLLPFKNTEIAVTNMRLLLRRGRFRIHSDAIEGERVDHVQLHQTPFSALLHFGTVILNLKSAGGMKSITFDYIWHPMTLLEALTTLNPVFRRDIQ